jgi:polysaccharide export outer membrane protein
MDLKSFEAESPGTGPARCTANNHVRRRFGVCLLLVSALAGTAGCRATGTPAHTIGPPVPVEAPRELQKAVLPTYRIEPPDVLVIGAVHLSPPPSYPLRSGDVLFIQLPLAFAAEFAPIEGQYPIGPGGVVSLGPYYGAVKVDGMTVEEASRALREHLEKQLKLEEGVNELPLTVALFSTVGLQQVEGQHLVAPDGTVTLGMYGSIPVVGLTLTEAKFAIENFLSRYFERPEVSVDVLGYNSKVYYVVTQGAGLGDNVVRLPVTGNDTVLDALANVNGIPEVASKRIWVARPGQNRFGEDQVLPVDYQAITARGNATSNYQLLPGDRLFIAEDKLVAADTRLAKVFAPLERMMGFSLLGVGTVTRFSGQVLKGGGARNAIGQSF